MSRADGDWLLVQELFERADPSFVDELRKIDDADALGAFATRWFDDKRPEARQLLNEYLARPLNAFRHEALVKRLFKLAEAAGDDPLMGRFLVAFDRSIRRVRRRQYHSKAEVVSTEREANELAAAWRAQGLESVGVLQNWQKRYSVWGHWHLPVVVMPAGTSMPRGKLRELLDFSAWDQKARRYRTYSIPDWVHRLGLDPGLFRDVRRVPDEKRKALEQFTLYSVATRQYLRRRSWRYFRKLGRAWPERYVPAVSAALTHYRDDDAADAVALLDNFGLNQILFRFSPCLEFGDRGCRVAPGHSLAELEPAPRYAKLWALASRALIDVLIQANCRVVRSWAVKMIRRNLAAVAAVFPLEERLELLSRDDPDVVNLVAELLREDPSLKDVAPERWLQLVETASQAALEILCELMHRFVAPERITLAQAAHLAMLRPVPVARMGLAWLRTKVPQVEEDCRTLLGLGESESEAIRPEIIRWVAEVLSQSALFRPDWVLEWLDSRHKDVRAEGLKWFREEPRAREDVTIWQRLMETPYDELRLVLVADLEARSRGSSGIRLERGDLDPELLKLLWASVLLNIQRGNRAKPIVVRQLLARVEQRPGDLPRLLPLLAVALRSIRGPEWRSGLSAVVRLAERDETTVPLINAAFPELQLG